MLVTEELDKFIHTYSDAGFYILQKDSGIEYADAMDLKEYAHEYEETDHKIEEVEVDTDEGNDSDTGTVVSPTPVEKFEDVV